ncbi:hypothetical protein Q9966_014487 [Columba livia]|nr:hypothetical protein Q9966_014487 [Columba livia]
MWDSGPQPGAGGAAPGSASCCRRRGQHRLCWERLGTAFPGTARVGSSPLPPARHSLVQRGPALLGSARLDSAQRCPRAATAGSPRHPLATPRPEGTCRLWRRRRLRGAKGLSWRGGEVVAREHGRGAVDPWRCLQGESPAAPGWICWLYLLLETRYRSGGERCVTIVHQAAWLNLRAKTGLCAAV